MEISDSLFHAMIPLDALSGVTSIFCLAAISLERMIAVKFPSTHLNLKKRPVLAAICSTWITGNLYDRFKSITVWFSNAANLFSIKLFYFSRTKLEN